MQTRREYLQRYAILLRLQAQGPPSLVDPLGGTNVHWTFVCFRLAHAGSNAAIHAAHGLSQPNLTAVFYDNLEHLFGYQTMHVAHAIERYQRGPC